MTHLLSEFRGKFRRSKPKKHRLTRIEKQQKEYEEKGYYTEVKRGNFFVNTGGRVSRSPYAKGDFETQKDFEKRSKRYTPLQRKQGREGTFKPDLD